MNSPKNLDLHIKVLKQLRNRQKRKIQQLLEIQSESKQSSDQISEIINGASSTCERTYFKDVSTGSTKSECRIKTLKSCLKQNSKFENLLIENELEETNRGSYSSLRKYNMHIDVGASKLVQAERFTDGSMTSSSTPKNQQDGLGFFPSINCTVPRIKFSDDSLPAIKEKHNHEYLSPINFKGDECRQKLSTFANKQKLRYSANQHQYSDHNEPSETVLKIPCNQMSKNYGMILRNDLNTNSSCHNRANFEFTSYPETDKNTDTIERCSSDDEMFYNYEDIVQTAKDECGEEAAKHSLISTQALPQIFPEVVVVQDKKRTELKKKINFQSTTDQHENLKKLQSKLKLKKESDPHLKCIKLNPKLLKNKSNDQSTKISKEIKSEIEVTPSTPPTPQKIKVHNLRSFGIMKKSY